MLKRPRQHHSHKATPPKADWLLGRQWTQRKKRRERSRRRRRRKRRRQEREKGEWVVRERRVRTEERGEIEESEKGWGFGKEGGGGLGNCSGHIQQGAGMSHIQPTF